MTSLVRLSGGLRGGGNMRAQHLSQVLPPQELGTCFLPSSSTSWLLFPTGVDLPMLPARAQALQLSPAAGCEVSLYHKGSFCSCFFLNNKNKIASPSYLAA